MIALFVILYFVGAFIVLGYLIKTAEGYGYVLDVIKKKQKYDPMDFLDETKLSVYLARRRYSRALREKQRLENTNRDKLNY